MFCGVQCSECACAGNVVPQAVTSCSSTTHQGFFMFVLSKNENEVCTGKSQGNI